PASASFSTPIICSSVNRFFMTAPLRNGLYIVNVPIAGSRSQPGISRRVIDAHLADLMMFGVDYAKRGGAARAFWLVSE
uniref:hypothetical protein n=1 Tax=Ralstonia solanacearum TaxID=305 RepID=UPI001E3EB1F2